MRASLAAGVIDLLCGEPSSLRQTVDCSAPDDNASKNRPAIPPLMLSDVDMGQRTIHGGLVVRSIRQAFVCALALLDFVAQMELRGVRRVNALRNALVIPGGITPIDGDFGVRH